jgi:GMP synthase-like glutamine amidotransferase
MPELLVLQHFGSEGSGRIGDLARERGWSVTTLRPPEGDPLPPHRAADQILLVMGGPMGLADRHRPGFDWMRQELTLIEARLRQRAPVLGICLGAQLLAQAAGGAVVPLEVGEPPRPLREVGWGAVSWTADAGAEPVLAGLDPSQLVLHWHGDRIQLPPGATLLGSSLHCPEQFFRLERHAWGLQFHVEVTPEMLTEWLRGDADYVIGALGPEGPRRIAADTGRWGARAGAAGDRLIANLLDALAAALPQGNGSS